MKRVFLIILDSLGIGELPDAARFGDEGSNTLAAVRKHPNFHCPNLEKFGIFAVDGFAEDHGSTLTCYARMGEKSKGKDTTVGHWEIAGLISEYPLPTYPNGFPKEIIEEFEKRTGRGVLCNKPYSGTDVIRDYGEEHIKTGKLIVYTSADSVFQIAAHEAVVPVEELYRYCEIAREMLQGEHGVGRIIARPFEGEYPFKRTSRRHDYSLVPPADTVPKILKDAGFDSISVGKIYDIFAGVGFTESHPTTGNADGMYKTNVISQRDFNGLCFINLVEFDMTYGHRNDVAGYARALSEFDVWLGKFIPTLRDDDLLIITGDHGCDPSTPSTDHSREYTPMLAYGKGVCQNKNLGTRESFSDIGATILEYFGLPTESVEGKSFLKELLHD